MDRITNAEQVRNKFVETALEYALTYASTLAQGKKLGPSRITILADSDYYSHGSPSDGRRFIDFQVPLHLAHKTGLGSSAALVTALTAAVVGYYLPTSSLEITSEQGRFRLHNLAQAAHSAAQGKIGSGFDVAAAVFGSCVYRRFSPSIFSDLGAVGSEGFAIRLKSIVEDAATSRKWDVEFHKELAVIPKGLLLLMCDVDCGSETVGMVKKVLTWRAARQQEADLLWATLQKGNEELAEELRKLAAQSSEQAPDYENLKTIILTIRSMIREMSDKADVPIEPKSSTELIDKCCEIPGVIGGMVPGAGGFDAIALLVQERNDTLDSLRKTLDQYSSKEVGANIGKVKLMGVKQEYQGLKKESSDEYGSWTH